ncbi:phospholipase D-like domain-containing protein [Pontibacillus yanchengensis]|uniref:phospholipase D n=1 Tax=Pontibacillus yanchengensis Y32 TaxID=1385514 RepID=A0A0A2TWY0_9BACI|nr:phospholipase D-like domain-containing protein [Pontibacillus yanchengensis]KGP73760.1 hypothetical protein N782_02515 [Pontibacillus yanchengensis Y32]
MELLITAGCSLLAGSYVGYAFAKKKHKETYSLDYFLSKTNRAPKQQIIQTIENASQTIDVAIFLFSDKNIAKELCQAAKRGVTVRVFTDREQLKTFDAQYKNIKEMSDHGIAVRTNTHDGTMHIKMLIADKTNVLAGSYNFTYNADRKNDELLMKITNKTFALSLSEAFENLWKDGVSYLFYQDYYDKKRIS